MNKKEALHEFIFTYEPHVIVGTETWLSPNVSNNEVISTGWNYNTYFLKVDQMVMVEL